MPTPSAPWRSKTIGLFAWRPRWQLLVTAPRLSRAALAVVTAAALSPPLLRAQLDPDGGVTSAPQFTGGNVATFGFFNNTNGWDWIQFACTPSGAVSSCSPPGGQNVPPWGYVEVSATYSTSGAGTGTVYLEAWGQEFFTWDDAWYDVTVTEPTPPSTSKMEPTGDVFTEFPTIKIGWCDNQSLNAGSRWIKVNGADQTASFDYNTADGPACTAKAASTTSSVALNYGSNTVEAHICDNSGNCVTDTYGIMRRDLTAPTISLLSPATVFTEFPTMQLRWCDNESLNGGVRWIKVNGAFRTGDFDYASGAGGCSVAATSTNINPISLAMGNNTLEAYIEDNWGNPRTETFTITRAEGHAVALVNHNGDNQDRSLCLTVPAGDAAAVQCGDLVAFHAMPGFRSLNRDRVMTLVYQSGTAEPRPRIAAQVTLGPGEQPLNVYTELTVNSTLRASATYASWTPEQTRQLALSFDASTLGTGIYPFTLLVRANFSGGVYDVSVQDTLIIVNRENSEFGAGWYLSGVEHLFQGQPGGSILWVGGDGSAKRYRPAGTGIWLAAAGAYRDSLVSVGCNPTCTFERRLKHGVTVRFDEAGRHIGTTDRNGNVTTINWDPVTGLLSTIAVPPAGSTYQLVYSAGKLDGIWDPAGRLLDATVSAGLLTQLEDPDTSVVSFDYDPEQRLRSRTNRRLAVTNYSYDHDLRVTRVEVPLGSQSDLATTTFSHWDELGLAMGIAGGTFAAADPAGVHTQLDGPRINVADVTRFWVDRWGAPIRMERDALGTGYNTFLTRGDGAFPALVTRVQHPNGQVLGAAYDARGNLHTVTDSSTNIGGAYATTRYEWDAQWDFVTRLVPPLGDSTVIAYDVVNGDRLWQQDARGSSSRVTFDYHPTGLLFHLNLPGIAAATYEYDGMGNLWRTTTPRGLVTTTLRDGPGRATMTTTPVDALQAYFQRVRTAYDAMNRVVRSYTIGDAMSGFARESVTVETQYDPEGNLIRVSRWSGPDPSGIDTITTQWAYDLANRPVKETAPDGAADSTVYDPAGNPVQVLPRRGDSLTMVYDVLNRLTKRRIPAVSYTPRCGQGIPATSYQYYDPEGTPCYPKYPNDGANYTIWADSALFSYDVMGNLTAAVNRDAVVRRGYFPNGLLQADTLRIRTVAGSDTTTHTYVLQYRYDLDGRRSVLKHPGNIAPVVAGQLKDSTTYGYDPLTGALATVTDPLGDGYTHFYNVRSELDSVAIPGGIVDQFQYDPDGHLVLHQVRNGSLDPYKWTQSYLRWAQFSRDAQGRLLSTYPSVDGYGQADTVTATYRALGPVVNGETIEHGWTMLGAPARIRITESATYDAFANLRSTHSSTAVVGNSWPPWWQSSTPPTQTYRYQAGTGRLRATSNGSLTDDTTLYDAAGNAEFSYQTQWAQSSQAELRDRANYYGADGTLRASETRRLTDPSDFAGGWYYTTFEEYRYDALGRRVLAYARRFCPPEQPEGRTCRLDKVRRTIWDGQEELYEIQMPADSGLQFDPPGSAYTESDTAHVHLPLIQWLAEPWVDPDPFFGRVLYTHGLGRDRPLGVVRMGYGDQMDTTGAVVAWRHLDAFLLSPVWMPERGQAFVGVFAGGGLKKCDPPGSGRCVYVGWPEQWLVYNRPSYDQATFWHGSLLFDKHDEAGTFFRRNRYYDSQTGRFTQEDPIGLAGGLNLYGFAGGDPINFSDPFGLCKDENGNDRPCKVELSPEGKAAGTTLEGVRPEVLTKLQELADAADVDLGINFTTNGRHLDQGHYAGTAVDIGYLNGKDIGQGDVTNPGMLELSLNVQATAARLGGLKYDPTTGVTGNLGPAGKFNGTTGPLPINNPATRRQHRNHIHLSYTLP